MAVFYSFHYSRDAWRVQRVVNMGALEGRNPELARVGEHQASRL